jgi:hypothetical protein
MKENSGLISEIIFSNFPPAEIKKSQVKLIFYSLKKRAVSFKEQFVNGAATLAIGTIFLVAIYLFFIQLAEYGW